MSTPQYREWVSFDDPDGSTWHFDLTFLASNYGCIFGRGCPGVLTELAPEYEHGCCNYGAHIVSDEDREAVEAHIARLTSDEWQFAQVAADRGGAMRANEAGELVTELVDDACICEPHGLAPARLCIAQAAWHEETALDGTRVCWQVPYDTRTIEKDGQSTGFERVAAACWGEEVPSCLVCYDDPLALPVVPCGRVWQEIVESRYSNERLVGNLVVLKTLRMATEVGCFCRIPKSAEALRTRRVERTC